MRKLLISVSVVFLFALCLNAQSLSSLVGTVTDPTGAVIPGAHLTLSNVATDAQREDTADQQGRYTFAQMQPGTYKLVAKAPGFNDVVVNNIRLLVNTPATVNVAFEKVGTVSTAISVSGEATQVNTVDASVGNAVGEHAIINLPFEARNVVGLLSIQPGVTYLGEPEPGRQSDFRSGAVNGAKSDQSNVTLDGIDVNEQQNRTAFSSVLRVTIDSVQEFRTVTANGGAEFGRTGGAQVSLITKSGSNTVHGSGYEFLRNTLTSANDFFNNAAGVPRQKLNRNVFGVTLGGPIKKNRLFYFLNYEGRRDASQLGAVSTVPTDAFRNGIFTYTRKNGTVGTLSPADIKALDPLHIGESQAALALFQTYPHPNDTTAGDQLNTSGYRFNAAAPLKFDTYIAKVDYNIDTAGKHTLFVRGNLQNDHYTNSAGLPVLPDQPASQLYLDNSKGYAVGYTAIVRPTLISTFRFGLTRQGTDILGSATGSFENFRSISNRYATTTSLSRITPVYQINEDLAWTHGAHSVAFGGVLRFIRNHRGPDTGTSFSNANANANYLLGSGSDLVVADSPGGTAYRRLMTDILGLLPQLTANYNYDLQGNLLPQGTPIFRTFASEEYEMYIQDTWKVSRALTVTAGLRYSLMPPVYETNGYQTTPNQPLSAWYEQRGLLASEGKPQSLVTPVGYDLASRHNADLYPYQRDLGPRIGLAYSPQGNDGLSKFLFGGPGKTSIRAGFGIFYDLFGQGIIRNYSGTALGLTSQLQIAPGEFTPSTAPRFQGFFNLPANILPPAPKGGFPQIQPDGFAITNSFDDKLKSPYSMNLDLNVGREFSHGLFFQLGYVGRLSRRSLINDDIGMPTNLKDAKSGMTYFQAASILATQAKAGVPTANVAPVAFWENLWPGAAGNGRTATQGIYRRFLANLYDWTSALQDIDQNCVPSCSVFGPYAIFNSQFSSLQATRSVGGGSYHSMQLVARKRFAQGVTFDFNYTFSKSIDLGSGREVGGSTGSLIQNTWDRSQSRAISDFDVQHLVSALAVVELPFGQGKRFLNQGGFLNAVVGGWQLSGIWRQSSGLPTSIASNGVWPTNWELSAPATQSAVIGDIHSTKNGPAPGAGGSSGPNLFLNPATIIQAFTQTLPGDSGQRNGIRGDGFFTIDMGLSKRFKLFTLHDNPHTLQFRAEAFNLTNSVRFDPNSANTDINIPATFGKYTGLLVKPRVIQFAARYDF
ncbi:MAG TPA: carboxypeptidase-like regulatory domain-containing protein [Bryobacteraceae bacterium]|nr:carboxypeptidase-like regulatory domain-containing protein [Bryobacteraceae bacterium]